MVGFAILILFSLLPVFSTLSGISETHGIMTAQPTLPDNQFQCFASNRTGYNFFEQIQLITQID